MKKVALPLTRLSFAQKLDLVEELWADLVKDEKKLASPAWHGDVLKEREEAYAASKLTVTDWEQAKKSIKKELFKNKLAASYYWTIVILREIS